MHQSETMKHIHRRWEASIEICVATDPHRTNGSYANTPWPLDVGYKEQLLATELLRVSRVHCIIRPDISDEHVHYSTQHPYQAVS